MNRLPQQALHYNNELKVCVGGIVVSIRCKDREFIDFLRSRYRDFITGLIPVVSINMNDQPPQQDLPEVEDLSRIKNISLEGKILRIEGDIFSSFLDMDAHQGEISQPLIFQPLDMFIYITTFLYLLKEGAFFLHASGIIQSYHSYLFFGPSGSGKSTIATISNGRAFAEDIVLIKREASGYYHAYGTPFSEGKNLSAPIKGMFRLRKADRNDLSILSPGMAVREVMDNIPFSFINTDVIKNSFDAVFNLIKDVPCHDLHFMPDKSFWEVIKEHIK
ncbi:MAG: hypothetical protein ACE5IH_07700 [Thermodesulfobacteriota bacterium]